jgi:hypothetical protein
MQAIGEPSVMPQLRVGARSERTDGDFGQKGEGELVVRSLRRGSGLQQQ